MGSEDEGGGRGEGASKYGVSSSYNGSVMMCGGCEAQRVESPVELYMSHWREAVLNIKWCCRPSLKPGAQT